MHVAGVPLNVMGQRGRRRQPDGGRFREYLETHNSGSTLVASIGGAILVGGYGHNLLEGDSNDLMIGALPRYDGDSLYNIQAKTPPLRMVE